MSASRSRSDPVRLVYGCLERVVPGTAAATHVTEICEGLRREGFEVRLEAVLGQSRDGDVRWRRYSSVIVTCALALVRADALYLRAHFAAFPLALLARLLGRPVIQEINGPYKDAFVTHPGFARWRGLLTWMQRCQYRWASALVAVSSDLVVWAKQQAGHDRVHLVSNAANTALFRPEGPRQQRGRRYVLFFGGLVRWHGVDVMLEAARRPAWPAGIDLVIAGPVVDESLRPLLERPPEHVIWLGPQPQPDLPPLIRGAVAVLVPISDPQGRSSHGVMPLKLFEALACGVPAIVTDLAGQADLVRAGGCGLVVPVDDPEALARAVAALTADPDRARRLGAAGARFIAAEHSWDRRAADTARIIRAALAAPRRSLRALR